MYLHKLFFLCVKTVKQFLFLCAETEKGGNIRAIRGGSEKRGSKSTLWQYVSCKPEHSVEIFN